MWELWQEFQALAQREGFDLIGVTTPLPGDAECAGTACMLVLAMPYQDAPEMPSPGLHISSYYFWENRAYHAVRSIVEAMRGFDAGFGLYKGSQAKVYACRAGLGHFGRNTLLQRQGMGSRFTLQLLRTSLPFPLTGEHAGGPMLSPACEGCARCVAACPTGALDGSGRLDRAKCLRHWMVQTREPMPGPLREYMGNRLVGCEQCQRACPENQVLPIRPIEALVPFQSLSYWLGGAESFQLGVLQLGTLLGKNLLRPLRLRCQLALLMGNLGGGACAGTLTRWAEDDEEILRDYAVWALKRVLGRE